MTSSGGGGPVFLALISLGALGLGVYEARAIVRRHQLDSWPFVRSTNATLRWAHALLSLALGLTAGLLLLLGAA